MLDQSSQSNIGDTTGLKRIEGFDECIIGVTKALPRRFIYNAEGILVALRAERGLNDKQAEAYFEKHFIKVYVGPFAPVLVFVLNDEIGDLSRDTHCN
jgi:hypothetical protein